MADTYRRNGDQPAVIDTGAPIPVSVEYVEAQLTELWRDVAEVAQARGGVQGVTTAQVLNLLIRAESPEAAADYIKDVEQITGHHPCRVILMVLNQQEDLPVQARVSIHCQLPPAGGRQVCCEQIWIESGVPSSRQIPAAVIPLLLSDLPVFLWWPRGAPFDDYLFRTLADSLNRLIVDSAMFENPEGTLSKMAERIGKHWPNVAVSDMNWTRLLNWRELVASFFDPPTMRPYLDRIDRVDIEFMLGGRRVVNRAQALLVSGWLASRLGWQPVEPVYQLVRASSDEPPTIRLSLQNGKRPVTITLTPHMAEAEVPGAIRSIRLEVAGQDVGGPQSGPEASFAVALADDAQGCAWVDMQVRGTSPTRRQVQLEKLTRAVLLDQELEVFSHDRVYEQALEMVGAFIQARSSRETEGVRRITTGEPISAGAHRTRPPGTPPARPRG
jgi:glucose-6-phosphate dehydrogenase assembly protein OpcA